ncbi:MULTISPECIES: HD-GYP domain-containing protein [Butyrivibrio]|uniref:HD-GYP domain-containing protein n=1 Tax=Butyrivibrio TaxID=830 RepID=UPI00040E630A|nr:MULTISPECIES: HD domain-containing phosphohydrolase [Butyrivibrio]
MKYVARMELKPGMVAAENILNYRNEIIVAANTKIDATIIERLTRQSIMAVPIKEEADFATTHNDKVRISEGFKKFESIYNVYFPVFKGYVMGAITSHQPIIMQQLIDVYNSVISSVASGEQLLEYLYNLTPANDEDMILHHCLKSALIAGVFGSFIDLSAEDQLLFIQCAFVYDIGKFSIPTQILTKPQRLTREEYMIIIQHTVIGYDFLKNMGDFNEHVLNAAMQHHERCDGTGYPAGLHSDSIDRFAKYIAIVDSYVAMTSKRNYRRKLNAFQIIANYEAQGFHKFDYEALNAILLRIANSQLGFSIKLNNGKRGTVIRINEHALSHPIILLNENNAPLDLSMDYRFAIEEVY